jgi:tRNA pseudouridine55 synthase
MTKSESTLAGLPVVDQHSGLPKDDQAYQTGCIILMDKPLEWTSFDVVKFVRSRIPSKKVGHAGTLDPLATGLLILCAGKATKRITGIQDQPKTYEATIRFGASTPSFDAETEHDQTANWDHITTEKVEKVISEHFTGIISQVPPVYSAKRIGGKRLYNYARKGEQVKIEPRDVVIHRINILEVRMPEITVEVHCGKGTYIRSLAHDLGKALGSLAFLNGLRRTETGLFHVKDALTPDAFHQMIKETEHG